eukprot:700680-Prymnesium_polylepis.1
MLTPAEFAARYPNLSKELYACVRNGSALVLSTRVHTLAYTRPTLAYTFSLPRTDRSSVPAGGS